MMEKQKRKSLDMLHGSIWNKLPLFALPVAAVGSYFDFYCNTGRNRRRHCRGIGCESLTVIPSYCSITLKQLFLEVPETRKRRLSY